MLILLPVFLNKKKKKKKIIVGTVFLQQRW